MIIHVLRLLGATLLGIVAVVILVGLFWRFVLLLYTGWTSWIRVDAKCPACGNRKGKLQVMMGEGADRKVDVCVMHTCLVCSAFWLEQTVIAPTKWFRPLDPRNPNEIKPPKEPEAKN